MAVLSAADAAVARRSFIDELNELRDPVSVLKADLLAAVVATDLWCDNNAASFSAALPLPARTALTAKQKARLLLYVIKRRYEVA